MSVNSRGGVYTVGIAIIAIAVLSLTIFSTQAIMFEEESEDYVAVMSDVRMAWQNTALLFDGAIKDAISRDTCAGLDESLLNSKYLNPAILSMNYAIKPGVQCTHSTSGFSTAGGSLAVDVEIECSREVLVGTKTKFNAVYKKEITYTEGC